MKTQPPSTNPPTRRLPEIVKNLGLTLTACTLVSCGTGSNSTTVSSLLNLSPGHHSKMVGDPLTSYPEGVPAFAPGDSSSGQWVESKAPKQSRGWTQGNRSGIDPLLVGIRSTAASEEYSFQRTNDGDFNIRNAFDAGKAGPPRIPFEAERLNTLGSLN